MSEIQISEIKIGPNRREVDPEKVEVIAKSIKDVGLMTPIVVTINNTLVYGMHRIEAFKTLGRESIPCQQIDADSVTARKMEIYENLARADLHWTEQDDQLAELKAIHEREHPETKAGGDRKSEAAKSKGNNFHLIEPAPDAFADTVAAQTGLTPRTIRSAVARAERLAPAVKPAMRDLDIGKTAASQIARLPEPEQIKVIEAIRAKPEISVREAIQEQRKAERDAQRQERNAAQAAQIQADPDAPIVTLASYADWLPTQPDADMILTDPPYSTDIEDIEAFAADWLPMALAKLKPTGRAYVFIGAYPREVAAYCAAAMPEQILVWTYRNTLGPTPRMDYVRNLQFILYYRGPDAPPLDCPNIIDQISVQDFNHPARSAERYHSWQKPDKLAERFIQHATAPGAVVLDPFCCTGTFPLAAARLGRIGRGCDISQENLDIAIERGCRNGTHQ